MSEQKEYDGKCPACKKFLVASMCEFETEVNGPIFVSTLCCVCGRSWHGGGVSRKGAESFAQQIVQRKANT